MAAWFEKRVTKNPCSRYFKQKVFFDKCGLIGAKVYLKVQAISYNGDSGLFDLSAWPSGSIVSKIPVIHRTFRSRFHRNWSP